MKAHDSESKQQPECYFDCFPLFFQMHRHPAATKNSVATLNPINEYKMNVSGDIILLLRSIHSHHYNESCRYSSCSLQMPFCQKCERRHFHCAAISRTQRDAILVLKMHWWYSLFIHNCEQLSVSMSRLHWDGSVFRRQNQEYEVIHSDGRTFRNHDLSQADEWDLPFRTRTWNLNDILYRRRWPLINEEVSQLGERGERSCEVVSAWSSSFEESSWT